MGVTNFLYNNPKLKHRRAKLRQNSTQAEGRLWAWIKSKQIKNAKFWRQYSIGPYILDFYCPQARLAIELDGKQHAKQEEIEYDRNREDFLKLHNISTIRFWNSEVLNHIFDVIQQIEKML